ncbi:MAG: SMC family ATPase [Candidatus Hinthialibacter antarcticus]|nr:SMC family ATPase [Candidatus Hinthialibacter antarcticus]
MIPRTLALRNFLSYGEDVEPLDFTSFSMACLTGRNGHGKSALLDAITWALWGEARKANYSRTPDGDLLRLSADEMSVEYTFELSERIYQVYREHRRNKRSGRLEFRVRDKSEEAFSLLTGSSKKETQKRIIETLRLDYRTFVNSSFLQQGKADAFTRQSPQERKEILGNILGLAYYDRLLEETKQRLSQTKAQLKALDESVAAIEDELADEDEVKSQETELGEALKALEAKLEALRKQERAEQDRLTQLKIKQQQLQQTEAAFKEIQKRIVDADAQMKRLQQEQKTLTDLVSNEVDIQRRKERGEQVANELNRLLELDGQLQKMEASRREQERAVEQERARLREALASSKSEQTQIEEAVREAGRLLGRKEEIERNYQAYQALQQRDQQCSAQRPPFDALAAEKQKCESEVEQEKQRLNNRLAELRGRVNDLSALAKQLEGAKAAAAQLPQTEEDVTQYKAQEEDVVEQGRRASSSVDAAEKETERLEAQIHETNEKLDLLGKGETQECPLCRQSLDAHSQHDLESHLQQEIKQAQSNIQKFKKQIGRDKKNVLDLRNAYKDAKAKREQAETRLSQLKMRADQQTRLQQEWDEKQALLKEANEIEASVRDAQFALDARTRVDRIQQEMQRLGYDAAAHAEIQTQIQARQDDYLQWNRLQEETRRSQQRTARMEVVLKSIEEAEGVLNAEAFAAEARQALRQTMEEMAPLQEALSARKTLHEEQQQLRNALTDWNRLQAAKERLPELERDVEKRNAESQELHVRLRALEDDMQAVAPQLKTLAQDEKRLEDIQQEIRNQETGRNGLQRNLGAVQEKRQRLEQRKQERKDAKSKRADLQRDVKLYDILRGAFSRDGIPALIVERALPELENDANRLLHRLTNGACSVKLESQRERKSGGVAETLDIKISDELGTRDYEMFSGGEAFRTDLALRIALSQLLCRRAGSRLQLLVIDEGFGTQDEDGLSQIVQAIDEIQDEFEKILVVTHLEELKEKFMVRIEVMKEPGVGSRYQVIHTF